MARCSPPPPPPPPLSPAAATLPQQSFLLDSREDKGKEAAFEGSAVTITAECNRYLHHMMRCLSGTLVQVGLGKMTLVDVAALLRTPSVAATAAAAPPPKRYAVGAIRAPATKADEAAFTAAAHKNTAAVPKAYCAPARGLCLARCFYGPADWPDDTLCRAPGVMPAPGL